MDWNNIREQVSNISLYDIKAGVRKVQNAVMNYTEMEAKVREATNNEPWGASSTLMQEIASATFNYQLLNEIMPMIYKRFTEKSAEEWRQIYKGLQLMEFLIKNGSERVIDDARSHLSLLKMLRQFHYIDNAGKDQGINVRNRSKELTELLSDVDRIRAERKKSRTTRNKYGGVEGGAGLGPSTSSSSRYGGFGSESGASAGYGGATRGVYGDGGGFGGESHDDYDEAGKRNGADRFDEYNEYDDGGATAPTSSTRRKTDTVRTTKKETKIEKPKEPEVDLFDFGDDPTPSTINTSSAATAPVDDDDFDDFQSAGPPAIAPATIPPPTITPAKPNYNFAMPSPSSISAFPSAVPAVTVASTPAFSTVAQPSTFSSTAALSPTAAFSSTTSPKPTGYQPSGPNYFQSTQTSTAPTSVNQPAKKAAGGDAFASLLAGSGVKKNTAQKGLTIADMAKQKSTAGLYGANATTYTAPSTKSSSGLDDLLG